LELNPSYNEKDLLLQVAGGDELAFARLFHEHHQSLGEYLAIVTQSKEAAEEIVQEAFVKAWQQRTGLPALQSFRSWLFIISRNQAYNLLRNQARRAVKHQEWIKHQELYEEDSYSKPDPAFLIRLVEEAVAQLPPQQQKAWLLSRSQGMKHAQIAEEMQLSRETVKRHISLALQSIAAYLRSHFPEALVLLLFYTGIF
jgi:RNA polymerase sigma-70 factor (ECF subfamily)